MSVKLLAQKYLLFIGHNHTTINSLVVGRRNEREEREACLVVAGVLALSGEISGRRAKGMENKEQQPYRILVECQG